MPTLTPTCTHWGNYRVETRGGQIVAIHPYASDPDPTPIGQSLLGTQDADCRVPQPMVRQSYLKDRTASDGAQRGREPFVPVSWDRALDLAAGALDEARSEHGNESIFGGSYG